LTESDNWEEVFRAAIRKMVKRVSEMRRRNPLLLMRIASNQLPNNFELAEAIPDPEDPKYTVPVYDKARKTTLWIFAKTAYIEDFRRWTDKQRRLLASLESKSWDDLPDIRSYIKTILGDESS